MRKKILAVFAVVTVLGLAGCQNDTDADAPVSHRQTEAPTETPTETPTPKPKATDAQYFEFEQTDDGKIRITKLKDKELDVVVIPDKIDGIPVGGIGRWAFENCKNLTSVTIPDGVTIIGNAAFMDCSSLTSVTIPDSVISINGGAFMDCSSLTSITIPNSVTIIGHGAFGGCSRLTSITIPDSVISIGDYAFEDCDSLTSITIPDSETIIGVGVFKGCRSLTSITIPDSVTIIGHEAFYGCSSLTSITIPASVTSIGDNVFDSCNNLTSITIPDSVTSIGDVFFGYEKLEVVFAPKGSYAEQWVKDKGFFNVQNYTPEAPKPTAKPMVTPAPATDAQYFEFEQTDDGMIRITGLKDDGLEVVVIPDKIDGIPVTSIGRYAFSEMSLTSITIPASVTSIGWQAFEMCGAEVILVPKDSYAERRAKDDGRNVRNYTPEATPASVIDDQYFWFRQTGDGMIQITRLKDDGLEVVVIPDKIGGIPVTSIGEGAFGNCDSLTSITIPASVTSIGDDAFSSCSSLTSITIPDSVTSIGEGAFSSCDSLTSITIPDGVTSIGDYAFRSCRSLTSITIPGSVTSIGWSAFQGCKSLTSVTIPDSVTSIEKYAFDNCEKLEVIFAPKGSYAEQWAKDNNYKVQNY